MQKCCLSCPPGHWFVVCFILKTAFAQLGPNLSEVVLTDLKCYYYVYTANVNRQTADKLLFSYAIITGEYV